MKPRLFIVHGYQAKPHHHWFEWLAQQLPEFATQIIALPNSEAPQLSVWLSTLQDTIGHVDADTYIVAHSLGCVSTLHFLAAQNSAQLGGLLLVAGFAQMLPNLPQLDDFNRDTLPWQTLRQQIVHGLVLLSEDDAEVAPAATVRLSAALQLDLWRLNGLGHFTQDDGCVTLPEAKTWLQQTLSAQRGSTHDDNGNIGYDE